MGVEEIERNRDSTLASSHVLNILTDDNFLWQFTSARSNSNAEGILATSGVTPLPVNLESMPSSPPERFGAAKTAPPRKLKRLCANLYLQVRSSHILPRSKKKRCSRSHSYLTRNEAKPFHEFHHEFLDAFMRLGTWGRWLHHVLKVWEDKTLYKGSKMLGLGLRGII